MNLDFDYREFQRESQEKLARIYAESLIDQDMVDEAADETYNKIQKILNCQDAKKCHPYLYQLDMENVNECDKQKIDKIYETCVKRGVITEDEDECEDCDGIDGMEDNEFDDGTICGGPTDALTDQEMTTPQLPPPPETQPSFTVLYSASKDGQIKVGEFYANTAMSSQDAKNQCMDQLSKSGYSAVRVLAIEQNQQGVEGVVDGNSEIADLYDVYEDDSEDFEKQETGASDETEGPKDDIVGANDDLTEEPKDTEDSAETEGDKMEEEPKADDTETDDVGGDETEKKEDSEPTEKTDVKDDSEEDSEDEDSEEDSDKEEKLSADQKQILRDEYNTIFKGVLKDMKLDKSVNDMTLEERTDFYKKLSEKWTKNDPADFMKKDEQEKLNNAVVKTDK